LPTPTEEKRRGFCRVPGGAAIQKLDDDGLTSRRHGIKKPRPQEALVLEASTIRSSRVDSDGRKQMICPRGQSNYSKSGGKDQIHFRGGGGEEKEE